MKEKNLLTVLSIGQEELNHMHCIDMRCTATGFKILIFFFLVRRMVVGCQIMKKNVLILSYCSVSTYKCFILNNITGLHLFVTVIFFFVFSVGT
jgi:hypothetical protein